MSRWPIRSDSARFLDNCRREGDCWIWQKYLDPNGYGHFNFKGEIWLAHRAAYLIFVEEFDDSLTIDHLCRNPSCVNPMHLEPVTLRENIRRVPARTHCKWGHVFSSENTYRYGNNWRYCKACILERTKIRRAQKRRAG